MALVSTIIRLGQTMNLETVAEGIERVEEMLLLRRQGCTTGQGFHFSPPVAAPQLTELLNGQSSRSTVVKEQRHDPSHRSFGTERPRPVAGSQPLRQH